MSDTDQATASKPSGKWTDEEKTTVLLQIIGQLLPKSGGKISITDIEVPNRTDRAIGHFWNSIKKEITHKGYVKESSAKSNDNDAPAKSTQKQGKRKLTDAANVDPGPSEEVTPKKARKVASAKIKKTAASPKDNPKDEVKQEHSDDEDVSLE